MPGIGSIHALQLAMREGRERRGGEERLNFPGTHYRVWHESVGIVEEGRNQRGGQDRRHDHEFAAALQAIREAEREPLVRCIREMGEEIRRLRRLVEEQGALLEQADHAEEVA